MRSRPNVLLGAMLVVATFGCGKGTVDTGDSCVPECGGRECGTDGCGGTCGPCDGGMACNDAGRCMAGHLLTVSKAGTGNGTVKGGAIDCGPICSANLAEGASVTLVAMPSTGSSFSSWSGCDSATGRSCTVTMNRARTVTATFSTGAQDGYTLTVWKTGDGIGTVSGSGIDCGAICSASFAAGTNVTLTAVGLNTSILTSWDGCDWSNDTTCMVAMNRARTVTATFSPIEPAGSGPSRSPIPVDADHSFRPKPITDSGGRRSPIPDQADR